jgi:hypothetical protein
MGERVVNGSFATGTMEGWTGASSCGEDSYFLDADFWEGKTCGTFQSWLDHCTTYFEQVVDLTGVTHITFLALWYLCYWSEDPPYGKGRFLIDGNVIFDVAEDVESWASFDATISGFVGNHTLRFEVISEEYGVGGCITEVSAIGPDPTPPPVANFSAEPVIGLTPLEVQFVDLSTNSPTNWIWDFDDGWAWGTQNPVHTYKRSGAYSPSLTVQNEGGSDTITKWSFILVAWTIERYKPMMTLQIGPDPGTEPIVLPLPPCWIDGDPPP